MQILDPPVKPGDTIQGRNVGHAVKRELVGLPDLALVTTCLCWGLNFVITKSATGSSPEQFRIFVFNIIRFPIAAALLFATIRFKGDSILLKKKHYAWAAFLSFVGIFLYQLFYMIGQNLTQSANIGIGFTKIPSQNKPERLAA